jgi:hypothetical protein
VGARHTLFPDHGHLALVSFRERRLSVSRR